MSELIIPQINNNDTHAVLLEWAFEDGATVEKGEVVAVLETSKSTFDLVAEESGIVHIEKEAGEEYAFGARLGTIGEAGPGSGEENTPTLEAPETPSTKDLIVSDAARRLIERNEISMTRIQGLKKRIVREKDVLRLLGHEPVEAKLPDAPVEQAPQSAVARVVTRSHREIPTAFLVKRIYCDRALDYLKQRSAELGKMFSLPDLFVHEIGRLGPEHPLFFANVDSAGRLQSGLEANVGVTFDFGKGLFVPVISKVGELSLEEVAKRMMRFRMKAMRAKFVESDLMGGALSLSLNMDTDTEFVRPLILPPQTCMLSLGALLSECYRTEGGDIGERRYLRLGVAYDHRFINGFESQVFAAALKNRIENIDTAESIGND